MPLIVNVIVEIAEVPAGGGNSMLGQLQADVAGTGQTQLPHIIPFAQRVQFRDSEAIPVAVGSEGSVTLANINTALTTAVASLAGSTGTPIITPAALAEIQGWASGGT